MEENKNQETDKEWKKQQQLENESNKLCMHTGYHWKNINNRISNVSAFFPIYFTGALPFLLPRVNLTKIMHLCALIRVSGIDGTAGLGHWTHFIDGPLRQAQLNARFHGQFHKGPPLYIHTYSTPLVICSFYMLFISFNYFWPKKTNLTVYFKKNPRGFLRFLVIFDFRAQ